MKAIVTLFLCAYILVMPTKQEEQPIAKSDYNSNLVIDLQFEGNIIDNIGHQFEAHGSPTFTTDAKGQSNGAIRLNGVTDFLSTAAQDDLTLTNGFTIYAKIRPQGFYNDRCHGNYILSKGAPASSGYYGLGYGDDLYHRSLNYHTTACSEVLVKDQHTFVGGRNQENTQYSAPDQNTPQHLYTQQESKEVYDKYVNTSAPIELNKWYTVVYTYDRLQNVSKLFVDGKLVAENNTVTEFSSSNDGDLLIGRVFDAYFPDYTYFMNGDIDALQIFNACMLDSEASAYDNFETSDEMFVAGNKMNIYYEGNNSMVAYDVTYATQTPYFCLYDLQGTLIKAQILRDKKGEIILNNSNTPAGIYFGQVITGNNDLRAQKIEIN